MLGSKNKQAHRESEFGICLAMQAGKSLAYIEL